MLILRSLYQASNARFRDQKQHLNKQIVKRYYWGHVKSVTNWEQFVGKSTQLGTREHNDDRYQVGLLQPHGLPIMNPNGPVKVQPGSLLYCAVFDGHGGHESAEFAKENLHNNISLAMGDLYGDITKAFAKTQIQLQEDANKRRYMSGTTAAIALMNMTEDGIILANTGDSQVVLCHKGRARPLTRLHSPNNKNEQDRFKKEGGTLNIDPWGKNRLNGVLEVTRALGTTVWMNPGVSAVPDVATYTFNGDEESFFIIGSDGIFNRMTCQEAVDLVQMCTTPQEAADALTLKAVTSERSADNATAIVVRLKGWRNYHEWNYTKELKKRNLENIFGNSLELSDEMALLIQQNASREAILRHIFDTFDVSKSGKISISDIRAGMFRFGSYLDNDETNLIVITADHDHDTVISFQEFCKMHGG